MISDFMKIESIYNTDFIYIYIKDFSKESYNNHDKLFNSILYTKTTAPHI